jgi:hypothetical protein
MPHRLDAYLFRIPPEALPDRVGLLTSAVTICARRAGGLSNVSAKASLCMLSCLAPSVFSQQSRSEFFTNASS